MSLQLSFAHASATGPREENQDALRLVTPAPALAASKGYLFALADGVSQCADGAMAAQATLQALALDYYATPETWPVAEALDRLLAAQNRWLQANGGGQPLLTTLTALVLRGRRFTLAHVGDCRAYRWQASGLQRLTEDHVWDQPGMQHVLKRAMGLDQHLVVDYQEGDLQAGDTLLLLSDGVWAHLADHEIARILMEQHEPQHAVETLVRSAHLAGSQDNASALWVKVTQLGEASLGDTLAQLEQRPLPPLLKHGQTIDGLRVDRLLNTSRQSLLYRVIDDQQRPWLLKTLAPQCRDDIASQQALILEEWFLKRVAGRCFPEVQASTERRHLYYLMREHAGQTLAEQLAADGSVPLAQWLELAPRLLRAVGLLHRRNILHRDIKPENILLGTEGELRLLDFGLAYCPGLSAQAPNEVPGTPSFIAPEAFAGGAPQPSHDLYATGVTLYRWLTGHYPYGEVEAFQQPRFGSPASPSRYRPDIPEWLERILLQGVHVDPESRFETAEQWLLQLERGEAGTERQRPRPLLQREPVKVWRTLALGSLLINLIMLLAWLHG